MEAEEIRRVLQQVKRGKVSIRDAMEQLRYLPFEDLGFAKLDRHRGLRKGFPEVVFCQGKTTEQVAAIVEALARQQGTVLATRATREAYEAVCARRVKAKYHESARAIVVNPPPARARQLGPLLVISAGTADLPVAEEAALTAELMKVKVNRLYDVGVAGLHRLLEYRDLLRKAKVIVVVAGMEGALPSVVAGFVEQPVIAVPTSVGYGGNFAGVSALLTMLNSCASGMAVVNIDNGFGAGFFAASICRLLTRK